MRIALSTADAHADADADTGHHVSDDHNQSRLLARRL
jgi:hypothetical protein